MHSGLGNNVLRGLWMEQVTDPVKKEFQLSMWTRLTRACIASYEIEVKVGGCLLKRIEYPQLVVPKQFIRVAGHLKGQQEV